MTQNPRKLAELLRKWSVKRGDFVLASGARSDFYLDVRRTALTSSGAHEIGREALDVIQKNAGNARGCGGLTLGADPIITAICCAAAQQDIDFSAVIVRKQAKGHGTQNWLEIAGDLVGNEELVAVDDVITTAGSTITAIERMRDHGFRIEHAVCIVDRESGGSEALATIGVQLHALFKIHDLLD